MGDHIDILIVPLGFNFHMKLYAPHSMEIFTVGLKNQYRDLLGMFFSDNLQPTALEFYFFF